MSFKVRILQVQCGDAIVITFQNGRQKHNIFIDGGYLDSYTEGLLPEIKRVNKEKSAIDPWVLTHLDADHINGYVAFLRDETYKPTTRGGDLWFNCFDKFRVPLKDLKKSVGKGIEIRDSLSGSQFTLNNHITAGHKLVSGGATIEVLAPEETVFQTLRKHWKTEEGKYWRKKTAKKTGRKKGSDYGKTITELSTKKDAKTPKTDITNLSSIAFMLTLQRKRILFLGDAYTQELIPVLHALSTDGKPVHFDHVKLSHHGSRRNFSSKLLDVIECSSFIISSNGTNSHFIPDKEVLAKILKHPKRDLKKKIEFIFNYDNPTIRGIFAVDKDVEKTLNFKSLYPKKGKRYYELEVRT